MTINDYIDELVKKHGKDYDGSNDPVIKKHDEITRLLAYTKDPLFQYFDVDSVELLDLKIEVLTAIKDGKLPKDIPRFYDIFELLPPEGQVWD